MSPTSTLASSHPLTHSPLLAVLDKHLLAGSGEGDQTIYPESKFVQLLGAHWWRRQLQGSVDVVAVSPGLIPSTGIGRDGTIKLSMDMPDAKTVPEGQLPTPTYNRYCV